MQSTPTRIVLVVVAPTTTVGRSPPRVFGGGLTVLHLWVLSTINIVCCMTLVSNVWSSLHSHIFSGGATKETILGGIANFTGCCGKSGEVIYYPSLI